MKYLFKEFNHLFTELFIFLLLILTFLYIVWTQVFYIICVLQNLFPNLVFFSEREMVILRSGVFNFLEVYQISAIDHALVS